MQSSCEADDLLAEAVAHEEYRVLRNVGHQCRRGALVETAKTHLFVGGHDAVDETPVQCRKGLHLDLCCVQRLPTEDTCSSTLEEDREKSVNGKQTLKGVNVTQTAGKSKIVLNTCAVEGEESWRALQRPALH